jgi:hypothetical protein
MNDALLEEISLAYHAHDLRPIRGFFCLNEGGVDYACPIVCLAVHRGVTGKADPDWTKDVTAVTAVEWAARTLGDDFTIGLLDGFDGHKQARDGPEYLQGFALGVAAARQLSPRDTPV